MYSDFLLIDSDDSPTIKVERLAFGNTSDRNEAWLQETLFKHAELLPTREIDTAYSPLIPLCRELRTEAGPIDLAFINAYGRLTLVECKLWRNPEARRKVVAQILDYARVINRWSYSDLQRQVSMATGRKGNVPFEIVRERFPNLREQVFVDQVALGMRQGRFLLIIAGDGIREDVSAIAELITRNAALGFSFGLVEIALYGMPEGELLIQPRVVTKTQIIERTVVEIQEGIRAKLLPDPEIDFEFELSNAESSNELGESPKQAAYRRWWQPVIDGVKFDDPDQEPPKLYWPNNIRVQLPWQGTWILCYGSSGKVGICTAGRNRSYQELIKRLDSQHHEIRAQLPIGTEFRKFRSSDDLTFSVERPMTDFPNDDACREWLVQELNTFVNVFRPRIKRLTEDLQ